MKSLAMISIFLIIVFIARIHCEDFCQILKPNGKFEGIGGVYRRWEYHENWRETWWTYSYQMFAFGKRWEFEVNVDKTNRQMLISFVNKTVKNMFESRDEITVIEHSMRYLPYYYIRDSGYLCDVSELYPLVRYLFFSL